MTKEVTDAKPDESSDQPEEEYGFMEAMTLDSEDEDEVENVPKSVPKIVPNRQKSPEPMTLDSEDEDEVENVPKTVPKIVPNRQKSPEPEDEKEVKIEVKEDKNPQVLGFPTGQNFLVLRTKGQPQSLATGLNQILL